MERSLTFFFAKLVVEYLNPLTRIAEKIMIKDATYVNFYHQDLNHYSLQYSHNWILVILYIIEWLEIWVGKIEERKFGSWLNLKSMNADLWHTKIRVGFYRKSSEWIMSGEIWFGSVWVFELFYWSLKPLS